jgi:hypothetical protein
VPLSRSCYRLSRSFCLRVSGAVAPSASNTSDLSRDSTITFIKYSRRTLIQTVALGRNNGQNVLGCTRCTKSSCAQIASQAIFLFEFRPGSLRSRRIRTVAVCVGHAESLVVDIRHLFSHARGRAIIPASQVRHHRLRPPLPPGDLRSSRRLLSLRRSCDTWKHTSSRVRHLTAQQ